MNSPIKTIFLIILLLIIGGIMVAPVSAATTWVVDDSGGADFTTIQAAVNAAAEGDTIIVNDGSYSDSVDIGKRLTIQSENGPESVIVQAPISVTANFVNLTGFTTTDITVYGSYCNITENIGTNCGNGIRLKGSGNTIASNLLTSCKYNGIWFEFSGGNNRVFNNTISNNYNGIKLDWSNNNFIYLNNVIGNTNNIMSYMSTNSWNTSEMMTYTYNGTAFTSYLGNYYSDYSGTDDDGNGVGTPAYSIDIYPLIAQSVNYMETEMPPAPVAVFSSDTQSGTAPLTVNFNDSSTGTPTSWAWDFDNDCTVDSTEPSPSHIYDTAGTYTVNLTVTNAGGGDSGVKTDYITVTAADPRTWYVDDSGGADFTTIQAAVTASGAGDTIVVRDGTYNANIVIDNYVTPGSSGSGARDRTGLILRSENGRNAVIINSISGSTPVIELSTPGVTIDGFTINQLSTGTNQEGIYVPVGATLGSYIIINNAINDVTYGIEVSGNAGHNTISNNIISTGNYPIVAYSIYIRNNSNNTITNNTCIDNYNLPVSRGIYLYNQATMSTPCTDNVISGNTVEGTSYGFYLFSTATNQVRDNSLKNNQYSFYLKGTSAVPTTGNVFYGNDIIDSTVADTFYDAYCTGNTWNSLSAETYWYGGTQYTGQVGNYWSNYAGSDADSNGIIDTPYQTRTSPDEFDSYPLMGEIHEGVIAVPVVAPTAAFTSDVQSGTAPLTVHFTDASTGTPTSWTWDFNNDGTVDSTGPSPSHIYDTAGTYTVNLTVTNAGGSDSEVKTDYITVSPPTPALLWGPYLTGTTTTGTVVNAKTNIATAISVEYATDAYYTANSAYDQSATDSVSTQLHHVSLAGLTPDTLYHYRVVYAGQATGDLHFSTFPASGAFTFVVYGDTQDQLPTFSQLERHKLVADRIAEEPDVAFVLNSGDLVNDASDLANWDRYFIAGSMMMANTTVYPALGNHDNNDPNYFANYGVPEYYSFDCGDGHIAVLNSNDWAWNDLPVQSAWLANDLQTDKPFKFTAFHHPLYTSEAKHFGGYENLRLEWEDDFIDNGVIAVFNGHVHAYERFLVNDINYFVAGIGGGPSYYLASPRYTGSQNSVELMIGYIRVTVNPVSNTATAEVIRVADVSTDLESLTTVYPPGTIFETVVMSLPEVPVAPTAAFTSNAQSGTAPLTVQFTDASTGTPTTWAWDFTNDGTVDSTEQSPSHVYDTAGTFTVNLTVTNAAGSDSEVKTGYITVSGPAPLLVQNANTGVRYATIQAAVTAAAAGDEIVVGDGAYSENVAVDKPLVVRSENGLAFVTVNAASPTLPVFDVNANGVVIRGFTIRGPTNEHVAGIEIVDFNDCLVIENDCAGCYNGIHIGGTGTNNTVEANSCHGNTKRGISVRDTAHDNFILKNTVESNIDAGICIKDTTANNALWQNDVIGNRVEILTATTAHSPEPVIYVYNGGTYTSYLGNYYADYAGTDADGNGVGTSSYAYGSGGDDYPLMARFANYVETTLPAPVAAFFVDPASGTVPLTVQFTDASTGDDITGWAWDFENDGTSDSIAQSPSHTYATAGTYSVSLTVTNAGGSDSETKTGYIMVTMAPTGNTLRIDPATSSVVIGQTRTVEVVLDEATQGIAGYNITVALDDGAKAEIVGISFPSWASVNQQGSVPGDTVWIKALDLNKQVESGATEVVLATITIRGDELGTTAITAMATVMDDDDGTDIDPAAAESSLSVTRQVPQLPGYPAPTDPNSDGMYEDLNGNGRVDFNDVVLFFNNLEWISVQDGFGYFDFNRNGRIDFDDVVRLFWGV